MNIYFSGIMGVGIGPLAVLSGKIGHQVFGSDKKTSLMEQSLQDLGATIEIGEQNGEFLAQMHQEHGIDWFVHSSAIKGNHPELLQAQELGLKISKRDELINEIIKGKGLKLIAVAGTHGKTTTTSMLIWCFKQLNIPVSFLNGTTLSFAPPSDYQAGSEYFIYEADEFDRNFLHFHPYLALLPAVTYDHPDIYPTEADYHAAFQKFLRQSEHSISWASDNLDGRLAEPNPQITLLGAHNRKNATLVFAAMHQLFPKIDQNAILNALNSFPGAQRRFEQIAPNIFSDYAHHPNEVGATLQLAREYAEQHPREDGTTPQVIAVYEPHQNMRQKAILAQDPEQYPIAFAEADQIFWLPTNLSRENSDEPPISPAVFVQQLNEYARANGRKPNPAAPAELGDALLAQIRNLSQENIVVLLSDTGLDAFVRKNI
ncbi:Mur ligase domain-containing protein [Candidatus Saccharibacteria bacterium]|nr:Mur ligase domain-containing protein [Candidatus Saccharibacteria bacterium]